VKLTYDDEPLKALRGIGTDAKIGLTSSLNLDLTVNPDFFQVEVDEQVTNLDRFEIYFPEKNSFSLRTRISLLSSGLRVSDPSFSTCVPGQVNIITACDMK